MATTNFNLRLDSDLKKRVEALYSQLGVSLSAAFHIFLQESLSVGGFPFDVRIDEASKEELFALLDADKISKDHNIIGLDVEEALKELKK